MVTCDRCGGRGEYYDSEGILQFCGACSGSGTAGR